MRLSLLTTYKNVIEAFELKAEERAGVWISELLLRRSLPADCG